jgi:protein-tyrosine phosphatase
VSPDIYRCWHSCAVPARRLGDDYGFGVPTPRASRSPHWDILVVCTANYCRSPYLAGVLRQALPALRIASAGTSALVGEPVNPQIVALLEHHGVIVRASRLIVTAEHGHRLEAIRLDRRAAERAVTLKELARLLAGAPAGIGVDGVLAIVSAALAETDPLDHDDDLADPYRRSWAHYRQLGEEVDTTLAAIVPPLRSGS